MRGWNGVRQRLRQGEAPSSRREVWQRIEMSRAGGATIELPRERSRTLPRVGLYGGLAIAVALALIPSRRSPAPEVAAGPALEWGWPFLPEAALAQAGGRPQFPPLDRFDGSRITPGTWIYEAHDIVDGEPQPVHGWDTVTVAPTLVDGEAAWVMTRRHAAYRGFWMRWGDSAYVRSTDLRPLRRVVFHTDSLRPPHVAMAWQFGPTDVHFAISTRLRDTAVVRLLPRRSPPWYGGDLYFVLPAIPFADRWQGSVSALGYPMTRSRSDTLPVFFYDLRVVGDGSVTVNAGRIQCWRVDVSIPLGQEGDSPVETLWVDRSSHSLVRSEILWYRRSDKEVVELVGFSRAP